jgi:hypothetical protein
MNVNVYRQVVTQSKRLTTSGNCGVYRRPSPNRHAYPTVGLVMRCFGRRELRILSLGFPKRAILHAFLFVPIRPASIN